MLCYFPPEEELHLQLIDYQFSYIHPDSLISTVLTWLLIRNLEASLRPGG
jgi:hypothetical protein